AYYQRRDPRPPMSVELVQNLITEVMQRGDRLVVLSFDHEVHDSPGEMLALSSIDPVQASRDVQKLRLSCRSGFGTARTAAMGRAIMAMRDLSGRTGALEGGIIYVVTDADEDRMPTGPARQYFDEAVALQRKGALRPLARIPQRSLVLEVWYFTGSSAALSPPVSAAAVDTVRTLVQQIIVGAEPTPALVRQDLERGALVLRPQAERWARTKGQKYMFELPVRVYSRCRVLHWKGRITLGETLVNSRRPKDSIGSASLVFPGGQTFEIPPGSTREAVLRVTVTKPPRIRSWYAVQPVLTLRLSAEGSATTAPDLFQATDPALEAHLSHTFWMERHQPAVLIDPSRLPALPMLSPPRALQILVGIAFFGAAVGAGRFLGLAFAAWVLLAYILWWPIGLWGLLVTAVLMLWWLVRRWPPVEVKYRVYGGSTQTARLTKRRPEALIGSTGAKLIRPGKERAVSLVAEDRHKVLDSRGREVEQIDLAPEEQCQAFVRGPGGVVKSISLSLGGEPPAPAPPRLER
ncbi:MAG: hypothetical protein ACUVRO_03005, partial [Armatimonadota bacterium]